MKRILLFLTATLLFSFSSFSQVPQAERNVLIAIYIESQGNLWLNNTNWNSNAPVSTWYGITIGLDNLGGEHVVGIDLTNNNLNGTLPSIKNLYSLNSLKLGNNALEGNIDLSSDLIVPSVLNTIQLNDNEISGLILPQNYSQISNGDFNIKNNPNLGCVQANVANLENLSLAYIDLGTIISIDCNGINNLSSPEKNALNDLYANTNGNSWSESTYRITDPTRNTANKGFTYIDIANVRHIKTIDLNQNNLNGAISSSFGNFSELTSLKLDTNSITAIPEELSGLTKLEILYLNDNYSITTLPTSIGNLSNLTELYIQNCNFNLLPTSIYSLSSLLKLNFSNNDITLLPEELGSITSLTELIASPNPFPSVPNQISNLVNLTILDLSGSLITNIPTGFSGLVNLEELYLDNNNLQIIFENGMGNLTELTNLTLHNNKLPNLPNDIGNLTKLTELTLNNNLLESLPNGIGNLTLLTELNLKENQLTTIPITIGALTGLTVLKINSNKLNSLPDELGNLVNLETLELQQQYDTGYSLTSLPNTIGNLTNLKTLNVSGVGLTSIPTGISNLTALTTLDLSSNQITNNLDLVALTSLSFIQLGNNKISGLTLGVAPISTYNNFSLVENPFLSCVQVPTNELANWNATNFAAQQLDNGVAFSDNCSGGNHVTQTEREALIAIYNAFRDTNMWTNWSTDLNENPLSNVGSWQGITTAQINGVKHVVEINLSGFNGIVNALPTEIGDFTELTKLTIGPYGSNDLIINTLPSTIGNLSNLTYLNLRYNNLLTSLPTEIGNLQNLESLDLYGTSITELPNTIGNLSNLKLLDVSVNQLTTLPTSIGNLSVLEILNIGGNKITNLPIEIGSLSSLLSLNVSQQYDNGTYTLTTIPTEINNITTLTNLDLNSNALVGDLDFSNLLALNMIGISSNEITGVKFGVPPANFCTSPNCFSLTSNPNLSCIEVPTTHLTSWQTSNFTSTSYIDNGVAFSDNCTNNNIPQAERDALIAIYMALANGTSWGWNIDPNSLSNVGAWAGVTTDFIGGIKHVTRLTMPNIANSVALPSQIGDLKELLELTVNANVSIHLTSLPTEIEELTKLTHFNFNNHTSLTNLPNEIGSLSSLTDLSIYNCGLTSLPSTIGNLSNLKNLYVQTNQLTALPTEVGNLSNLTYLTLTNNNINNLPSSIGNLSSLASIDLAGNELTSLPNEFNNIVSLINIFIQNNQLTGAIILDDLINLTGINLMDNDISSLKLGTGPLNYHPSIFNLSNNPHLTCVEVPNEHLAAWETSGLIGNDSNTDNGVIVSDVCSNTLVPNTERLALIAIHNALADVIGWANWNTDSNDPTNVGSWQGVTTAVVNGQKHVTKLTLPLINVGNTNSLPSEIEDLPELTDLIITGNSGQNTSYSISGLPTSIGNLSNLINLSLTYQGLLTSLPSAIGNLDALETLIMSDSGLTAIPVEVGSLNSIKTINLNGNELTQIPTEIGNNNTLEVLYLDYNQLTTLPSSIGNLQNLKRLNVNYNELVSVPAEINNIVTLEFINFNSNQIEGYLNLSNLTVLNQLWISSNKITGLKLNLSPTAFGNTTNQLNYNFQVASNDLGCIEVPIAEVVSWELSGASLDSNVIFSSNCSQENPTPQSEIDALTAFYYATNGSGWTNATNWLSSEPVSNWHGITVDGFNRVKKIELYSNNLTGTLPSEIEDFPELEVIYLSGNSIAGSLPIELGSLTNLKTIYLPDNNFVGAIPTEIGNLINLEDLRLYNNGLTGSLPSEIGNLTNLKFLFLQSNSLSGTIPIEMNNLYSLEVMYLQNNSLNGNLPTGNFYNAYSIDFSNNQLTGAIPSIFANSTLEYLRLNNNNLTGVLPNFAATPLKDLLINDNEFVFSDLETQFNYLNTNLITFNYSPQAKVGVEETIQLQLGDNYTLESNVGGVNNAYQWFKNSSSISGATNTILELTNIQATDFASYYCEITNTTVTGLTIETAPKTVSENQIATLLADFYNATDGANWTNNTNWLSNQPYNTWYGITTNTNGDIISVALANNNLTGTIVLNINALSELESLNLSNNNLTGIIPSSLGNFTYLRNIYLSGNQFSGAIPTTLGNIYYLENLDLSNNMLDGPIPTALVYFDFLEYLDLSHNLLTGEVPALGDGFTAPDINISYNNFIFDDLEPNFNFTESTANSFIYAPMNPYGAEQIIPIIIGDDITLTTIFDNGTTATRTTTSINNVYQWYKDDVVITGATETSYTIFTADNDDAGIYIAKVTNTNISGLELVSSPYILETSLGIDDDELIGFTLYPNPVKDMLTIDLVEIHEQVKLEIFDVLGKKVFIKNLTDMSNQISVIGLPSGIYMLRISTDSASRTERIIKSE